MILNFMSKIKTDDTATDTTEAADTTEDQFFVRREQLATAAAEAEAQVEKLSPVEEDAGTDAFQDFEWSTEPDDGSVRQKMQIFGFSYDDAYADTKRELEEDAKRLRSASPAASKEIG